MQLTRFIVWIPLLLVACQAAPPVEIRIVKLEHTTADEVVPLVTEIALDRAISVRVAAHSATNSVLLSGSRADVSDVERMIAALDVGVEEQGLPESTQQLDGRRFR